MSVFHIGPIPLVCIIFVLHFIGDFVLQPYSMKVDKTKRNIVLFKHVLVYTMVLFCGLSLFLGIQNLLVFCFISMLQHFMVDYLFGRLIKQSGDAIKIESDNQKNLTEKVDLWMPITFLGLDQLCHQLCLLVTLYYIF
jgi:hypothetical protein